MLSARQGLGQSANARQIDRMIPLSDENPTLTTPWMTWLIIGVTVAVWFVVQGAGQPGSVAA